MTLPVLIAKYREKVLITGAKKCYSTVINAINKWLADNGSSGNYEYFWTSFEDQNDLAKAIAKEMNAVNVCTHNDMTNCGGEYIIKLAKKTNNGSGKTAVFTHQNSNRIVLADGSFIVFISEVQNGSCTHTYWQNKTDANGNFIPTTDPSNPHRFEGEYRTSSNCGFIAFDTNGLKEPNQVGKDVFEIGSTNKGFSSRDDAYGNLNYVLTHDKLIKTDNYTVGDY